MIRKIYKKFRAALPANQNSLLSQLVFKYSGKPFVKKDNIPLIQKFPDESKGGMIISADFELAWAWRYAKSFENPMEKAISMAKIARKNFPELIKLFEKYNIPITWATVGHLFLEECEKTSHDWMEKIHYFENRNWRYNNGNWFDCDPHTNWKNANEWYAPDLIKIIQRTKVGHEISTHTFTHIDFSDTNCPEKVAEDEIKACIEAMKPFGLKPESIIFPGGTYGNIKVLKKYGIKIYRKNTEVDLAFPYSDEYGLLVSPTTTSFGKTHKSWTGDYYVKRFKVFIDKAIKTGTIAHFWFHPSLDEWTLKNVMPEVMHYAAEKREKGELWIGTMKQIADHILNLKK